MIATHLIVHFFYISSDIELINARKNVIDLIRVL